MRASPILLPGNFRRSIAYFIGFFAFVIFAILKLSDYVLADDVVGLAYLAMAFVGGAFIVGMLNNWRNGLYFFLTWLLFEDFARKYLGNNMAIFFAKDFLVAVVYISFFIAYRRKEVTSFRPPFLIPLLLLVWFGLMQVFNPASSHIVYGLLGMKVYFYYAPLLFVGYALLNSEAELRRFFFVNIILALIIVSLGIVQSILGHTFLNPAVAAEDLREIAALYRTSPVSGLTMYRPTSIFVSPGRFADYLLISWLLVFGFSAYLLLRHKRGRALAFLVSGLTVAGVALCASRGVVLWCLGSTIIGSAAFIWGAPWRQGEVLRVLRNVQRAVIGMIVAILILLATYPDALMSRVAFYTETLTPGASNSELQSRTWDYPVRNFIGAFNYERWPYGHGIGTASLGTQYVARIFGARPMGIGVESGFGTLVVEMGIVGLLLWLVMSVTIIVCAWKVVRKLRGSPWFPLAFIIFWYAFILLLPLTFAGMQPYQDFVLNAYLWLLLGVLFRLPSIAVSAQFAAAAKSVAVYAPRMR